MNKRIILSDSGTLIDHSLELNNFHSGDANIDFVAAEDSLFIGSRFPFNSIYFKVNTANASASVISIKYWENNVFRAAVEVIDETSVSGVSLSQSGYITFVPERTKRWLREDTTSEQGNENVDGLGGITIYDHYWIEIKFSADLDAGTKLEWIGDLFCEDDDLDSEFPFLAKSNVKTRFEAGKTDWQEQRVAASKLLIDDLVAAKVINSGDNILERRNLNMVCVSKTAEIIFNAFGDDYKDNKNAARIEYRSRIKKDIFGVDRNADARLSIEESRLRQGRLLR